MTIKTSLSQAELHNLGDQYQQGHLKLREASRLLELSGTDLIFELEQTGFVRPPSVIVLTEDQRDAIYQRLRQQRLAHTDPPVVNEDLVVRDSIACEGVDPLSMIEDRGRQTSRGRPSRRGRSAPFRRGRRPKRATPIPDPASIWEYGSLA